MISKEVVIGTRGSQLAINQAQRVAEMLADEWSEYQFSLQEISTTGDRILDKPLSEVGGKGLFIKEIEQELLAEKIDLAVHSMKDLPAELPAGLELISFPKRADVRDVLISSTGQKLAELDEGARVGTGSLRRRAQLLHYRPDLEVVAIRGNIDTRLEKLVDPEYNLDAIVLAAAGWRRAFATTQPVR
ncbi:MAG: hydroxymethylbilane synthase, partial [Bacillota bacterium]